MKLLKTLLLFFLSLQVSSFAVGQSCSDASYIPAIKRHQYNPVSKTLDLSWDSIACAEQYQLEWTFVSSDDESTKDVYWQPDFRFNATRVTTPQLSYSIPLIYDEGTLILRLRFIRKTTTSNTSSVFSTWSPVFRNPQIGYGFANLSSAATFEIDSLQIHEQGKLNWQYTATFLDEGQRKDIVSYYDGTLRERQKVSLSNTDSITIATTTIYDNQGRPAIQTIPAPVVYGGPVTAYEQYRRYLGYFNKQVLADPNKVYTYRDFDLDRYAVKTDSCLPAVMMPKKLSTASGVSRYFSSDNRDKSSYIGYTPQGYTPDAEGYPFLQTQWADDNTNRIIAQSQRGGTHYIGSGHETTYRYADVAQDEIDRLFGNDAGDERFYKKIIITDPNGQISVQYTRLDGKIVATALAGPAPDNLESITTNAVPINLDIVGAEQDITPDGLQKIASKKFDLSVTSECSFGYRLIPKIFSEALCSNAQICLGCKYNLQVAVVNDSGRILHSINTSIGTLDQNCSPNNSNAYRALFSLRLCKGSYTVTRTLTVDTSGFEAYYTNYLHRADSCSDTRVQIPPIAPTQTTCKLTCAECQAMGSTLQGELKQYCDFICNNGYESPCDQVEAMMLIDVSPGGQYAQFDRKGGNVDAGPYPTSIYYNNRWSTIGSVSVHDLDSFITTKNINGLVANWKPEWATYFLKLHPEYCYYQYCQQNKKAYIASKQFNDKLQGVPNASSAVSSIYIDPLTSDASLDIFKIKKFVRQKMDHYKNNQSLKDFIYSAFLNCLPASSSNFAQTPDTVVNNMQWQWFRAMYIAIKNQVIDSLREEYVQTCGGYCNKCIGDTLQKYTVCKTPGCHIPDEATCSALRKKMKLFPSTYTFQDLLPFKLTGVDSIDLAIIQDYTRLALSPGCKCSGQDKIQSIFNHVVSKKSLDKSLVIRDTVCSVGLPHEVLPGYTGGITWTGTPQGDSSLHVSITNPANNQLCTLDLFATDAAIPWSRIVSVTCMRKNVVPVSFASGNNAFTIELYDSAYQKYVAEATISCLDTASCTPEPRCIRTCKSEALAHIFQCGFNSGLNSQKIDLGNAENKETAKCLYAADDVRGKLVWSIAKDIRTSSNKYILTIRVDGFKIVNGIQSTVDSCQFLLHFSEEYGNPSWKAEVISVTPDKSLNPAADKCKAYGVKVLLKVMVDNDIYRYITVYGEPITNCFLLEDCCAPPPALACKNEFSNALLIGRDYPVFSVADRVPSTGSLWSKVPGTSNSNKDTASADLGIADILWNKEFRLRNPGYYQFSYEVTVFGRAGRSQRRNDRLPPHPRTPSVPGSLPQTSSILDSSVLKQQFVLWLDSIDFSQHLTIIKKGRSTYVVSARLPIGYKANHQIRVHIKNNSSTNLRRYTVKATDFSLVPETCEDCCLPVFPQVVGVDTTACSEVATSIDNHNIDIIRTQFLAALRQEVKATYIQHCIAAVDSFKTSYQDQLYHFTLYYYDQANNLVQTVPPKGVDTLSHDSVLLVQQYRKQGVGSPIYPAHKLASTYQFNSLNSITHAASPDAGTIRNWHDPLGRLVVSQQARQTPGNKYNYILYDSLNRIYQSGEFVNTTSNAPELLSADITLLEKTLQSAERHDVVTIVYDAPLDSSINGNHSIYPKNLANFGDSINYLRNRVAANYIADTVLPSNSINPTLYHHALHYWYDMHGYVKLLIHEIPELKPFNQQIKHVGYDYESLSGSVKKAKYQQGEPDQFYTRYTYDADKRLKQVETSLNDTIWERDARYYFFKHGPLARMELGADSSIQGVDYIYSIQGWLKAINSFTLLGQFDPGIDGESDVHPHVAPDVYGYEIGYYKNDYKAIWDVLNRNNFYSTIYDSLRIQKGLYNGNIRYTVTGMDVPQWRNKIQASVYNYDQLNRLTSSSIDTLNVLERLTAYSSTPTSYSSLSHREYLPSPYLVSRSTADYQIKLTYDNNGNILSLLRNGTTEANNMLSMDALTYHYSADNNQLKSVSDTVNASNYDYDIDHQQVNNYLYDSSGNLVKDKAEKIDTILWNVRGKMEQIVKDTGKIKIDFTYSSLNNRLSKTVNDKTTYYIADAGGNVLATYLKDNAGLSWETATISRSKRLGVYSVDSLHGNTNRNSGIKQYELTDHLGNVLITVSNKNRSNAIILSAQDYYPLGMLMPKRNQGTTNYKFGFNNQLLDNEIYGEGNSLEFKYRTYEPRLGRFLSIDPFYTYFPWNSTYSFAENRPIDGIDLEGKEWQPYYQQQNAIQLELKVKFAADVIKLAEQATAFVLSVTDVGDAAVLTTWMTRGDEAITITGSRAGSLDKGLALGGAVIPIVSGSAVAAGVKYISKAGKWSEIVETAINQRGTLRDALAKEGIEMLGKEAHHLIPVKTLEQSKVVQAAVEAGFEFNKEINGILVQAVKIGGEHGNHPRYTDQLLDKFEFFEDFSPGYTPQQAKAYVEDVANKLKTQIQKESVEGGKKINELILKK